MRKMPRSRNEKEGVRPRRGRQRLPLIPDQKLSLALWVPPAESVDGTAAFCYNYIAMNMEMYRSGRNENDSKSNWLFGSGFPVLLGFMRVFRLREGTIFWRSLLQFSPKFSQNARRILKFNIWSITQVVVRGRTRNAIGRETGARVRLPDAPPKTPQDDAFCGVFHCIFYFPASNTASTAFWTCSRFSASVNISSAWASKTAVEISSPR